jgi:hypothetical protein
MLLHILLNLQITSSSKASDLVSPKIQINSNVEEDTRRRHFKASIAGVVTTTTRGPGADQGIPSRRPLNMSLSYNYGCFNDTASQEYTHRPRNSVSRYFLILWLLSVLFCWAVSSSLAELWC